MGSISITARSDPAACRGLVGVHVSVDGRSRSPRRSICRVGTLRRARPRASDRPSAVYDRVVERRRAVALARHFREAEGLSVAQIADRLGRSPATIKTYFMTRRGRRAGRSRLGTSACTAAAAPTHRRGTARATPTRTASAAIRARSRGAGLASLCSRRCSSGSGSSGGCRPVTTGRRRTRGSAGERRLTGCRLASGRRRASSPLCSAPGLGLARRLPRTRSRRRRPAEAHRRRRPGRRFCSWLAGQGPVA